MSALPPPPDEMSVFHWVEQRWRDISTRAMKEFPTDADVERVEEFIAQHESDLKGRQLRPDFDWSRDIAAAKHLHISNKSWSNHNAVLLEAQRSFWRERSRALEDFYTKLMHEGFKYILALHGGTALACLNALASTKAGSTRLALLVGLFGGAIGIGMLAIGKLILIHLFARQTALINSRFTAPKGWTTYIAIGRWLHLPRRRRVVALADIMIYGSMLWFFLYAFVCALILSST